MRTLLALSLLLAPGAARAASGDIGCVETRLGAPAMARIGDGVITAFERNTDPARILDNEREALLAARAACRRDNSWSPAATAAAVSYAQARATRIGAEAALRRDRLDPAALSATYARLGEADRQSILGKPSATALKAIEASASKLPVRLHVLIYFAALSGIEFIPAEFAAA